jgi:2-polyprenyl-3-methyl-5-hydroxy-6-metoxy-1,4-benzoquinol methylase
MFKSERFWNLLSKGFDSNEKKSPSGPSKLVENTIQYLNSNDIVLDIGCATGTYSFQFAKFVKEIHGIDISSKMIESAKSKTLDLKIENMDFFYTTIFDDRFKKESYDVIIAFNVLHFFEDNQLAVKRINELLKPGGTFISTTACLGEENSFVSIILKFFVKIGIVPLMHFYKISDIKQLLESGDFQIIENSNYSKTSSNCYIAAKKI